ncbi:MAG: carboxypeptidase-like regulatory domain-containing protein [Ignavibacteria bacterium]|nr:carboxypeptidase-like regulatory domain-containing protein [Ignavibacteria bacterium]
MRKIYVLLFLSALISSLIIYSGCSDSGTDPGPGGTSKVQTTISGTVLDESNTPITGALVSIAGQSDVVTNASGSFIFSKIPVPKDRFVVNVFKTGYFKGSVADAPKADGTINIRVYLMSAGVIQTVDASTGGEATLTNGSKVKLGANIVTNSDNSTYTGNVNLSVGYLDPTSENFSSLIPGGDMLAQTANNTQRTLYSYGIIKVEMKNDAGADLKIKTGNQSEITVDIPPSMEATAPATIPLWHYDNVTGLWKEEGTATKQGDKYVGMVGHFSDWNCDVPEGTATVRGLVVDCNALPVPGISVKIGQAGAITGSDGKFERRVPANTAFEVQVLGTRNFGLTSTPVSVPALSEGSTRDVGTLTVQCPVYVKGIIKCGADIKFGQVVISWAGGYNSQYTEADGKFNLATDVGKNAEVSIYTFDGKYKTMNITTPTVRGEVRDLGVIEVCDQVVTGINKFTVNGSGFNNRTFTFATDSLVAQVYGYFDPADSLTVIWMWQVFAPDTIHYWFTFKGTGTGTPTEITMYFYHNSLSYIAVDGFPGSSSTLNITKYSGVGGLIEGTFSGTLVNPYVTGDNVTISNGQFSVVRRIIGAQIEKVQRDKIPIEIRKKLHLK